ncbi:MAG: C40 family peptidase [Oscillospiraceae bacterium]|nr:C40 family peptidase [Oscillospiraceae bacterium]
MNRKILITIVSIIAIAGITTGAVFAVNSTGNPIAEYIPDEVIVIPDEIKEVPKIEKPVELPKTQIVLSQELIFEINCELQLLSLVESITNGEIISRNKTVDTSVLGETELKIEYLDENIHKQEITLSIKIVDTTSPKIEFENGFMFELSAFAGEDFDLLSGVCVTDNSNEEIEATIEGEYDLNVAGKYILSYVAVDSSGNKAETEFMLIITEPEPVATVGSGKASGGGGGSSGGGSTGGGSRNSVDMSKFDTSNPMVARALELVGQKDFSCTMLASAALNAGGRSLTITTRIYEAWSTPMNDRGKNPIPEDVALGYHTIEEMYSWINDAENISKEIETLFHSTNNVITDITPKNPEDADENWRPSFGGGRNKIGSNPYFVRMTTYKWTEGNIKIIGTQIDLDSIRPGDYLFWEPGSGGTGRSHIAIYVGNGQAVHGGFGKEGNVVLSSMYMSGYTTPTAWRV